MIKANELRIGNLVLGASRGEFLIVSGNLIEQIERGIVVVGPITLTEEWLVRFGFTLRGNYLSKGNFIFQKRHNLWIWMGVYLPEIKHVHQLQNLYFALTGQELKLKDKLK